MSSCPAGVALHTGVACPWMVSFSTKVNLSSSDKESAILDIPALFCLAGISSKKEEEECAGIPEILAKFPHYFRSACREMFPVVQVLFLP